MTDKEKYELREEVYKFMEKEGHKLKLTLDGNPIPYGIVNHLIATFHEQKTELSKLSQHDVSGAFTMQDLMLYYTKKKGLDFNSKVVEVFKNMVNDR